MTQPTYYYEDGTSVGDNVDAYVRDGVLYIDIEEPWAGSTETGFGYTCGISMPADEARKFAQWILAAIEAHK